MSSELLKLLGPNWQNDLADIDAFAALAAVAAEAAMDLAASAEQTIIKGTFGRVDADVMHADAHARKRKAPPGAKVYKPWSSAKDKENGGPSQRRRKATG